MMNSLTNHSGLGSYCVSIYKQTQPASSADDYGHIHRLSLMLHHKIADDKRCYSFHFLKLEQEPSPDQPLMQKMYHRVTEFSLKLEITLPNSQSTYSGQ